MAGCFCEGVGTADLGLGRHGGIISGAIRSVPTDCKSIYLDLVGGSCAILDNMARAAVALVPILRSVAPVAAWAVLPLAAWAVDDGANDVNKAEYGCCPSRKVKYLTNFYFFFLVVVDEQIKSNEHLS